MRWHQLDHMQRICTSLQTDNNTNTSSLSFLQAGCSSWHPTNSLKALKANCKWKKREKGEDQHLPSPAYVLNQPVHSRLWGTAVHRGGGTDHFINEAVLAAQLDLPQQFFLDWRQVHVGSHHAVLLGAYHLRRIVVASHHHLRPTDRVQWLKPSASWG